MRVSVDQERCKGCGLCTDICWSLFAVKDAVAQAKMEEVPRHCETGCREAMKACPMGAIVINQTEDAWAGPLLHLQQQRRRVPSSVPPGRVPGRLSS